jgi:hypothetical protein
MVYRSDKNEDAGMLVRKQRRDGDGDPRRDDRHERGHRGPQGESRRDDSRADRPVRPSDGREGEDGRRRGGAEVRS